MLPSISLPEAPCLRRWRGRRKHQSATVGTGGSSEFSKELKLCRHASSGPSDHVGGQRSLLPRVAMRTPSWTVEKPVSGDKAEGRGEKGGMARG